MKQKYRVLILCTGNSARSQMAEAIINHDMGKTWQAFSAGIRPAGYVHPFAIKVLAEIGIDHRGKSKPIDAFHGQEFDVVITVCDDAAENCPIWLGKGKREHIGFPDPAKVEGIEEDQLASFRLVRDEIQTKVVAFLKTFPKS